MHRVSNKKLQLYDNEIQEAYNTLRSNIQFCGNEIKVITQISCMLMCNDKKSQLSYRLANSFAEIGKKVLFIEANIRCASVLKEQLKETQEINGLSHYLAGQKNLDEVLYETNISGLNIIFAGSVTPNPASLIAGKLFSDLIKCCREQFEYVIIDSPPLGSVIDGALVARECDGAVLIIESGVVSYRLARKIKFQLERSGCRILGAVLRNTGRNRNR